MITDSHANFLTKLHGNTFRNADRSDSSGLSTDDSDFLTRGLSVLQNVLWHLGGLAAASVSRNDQDLIAFKFSEDLGSVLGYWKLNTTIKSAGVLI